MKYFYTPKLNSHFIRPWPYPYKGGLSISNDAEFMSYAFFETLMYFTNTSVDTAWGKGLNIPMSSSVFFYSAHNYNFSYVDGITLDAPLNPEAKHIDAHIKNGWIDTLHAYGDFDHIGGFTRAHAERCLKTLDNKKLKIKIFTNHGGVENIQNVGVDAAYHEGDKPNSPAYHADLMAEYGIKYIWSDSMVSQHTEAPAARPPFKTRIKDIIKKLIRWKKTTIISDLPHSITLNDGQKFKGFMRFRSTGENAPNLSSFKHQIEQIEWHKMYATNAGLVIYQHFGVLDRIDGKCIAAKIEDVNANKDLYLTPFYKLQEEHTAGRLWIARLEEYLDYLTMIQNTSVKRDRNNTYHLSTIDKAEYNAAYFKNLTLSIKSAKAVQILYRGIPIKFRIDKCEQSKHYCAIILP